MEELLEISEDEKCEDRCNKIAREKLDPFRLAPSNMVCLVNLHEDQTRTYKLVDGIRSVIEASGLTHLMEVRHADVNRYIPSALGLTCYDDPVDVAEESGCTILNVRVSGSIESRHNKTHVKNILCMLNTLTCLCTFECKVWNEAGLYMEYNKSLQFALFRNKDFVAAAYDESEKKCVVSADSILLVESDYALLQSTLLNLLKRGFLDAVIKPMFGGGSSGVAKMKIHPEKGISKENYDNLRRITRTSNVIVQPEYNILHQGRNVQFRVEVINFEAVHVVVIRSASGDAPEEANMYAPTQPQNLCICELHKNVSLEICTTPRELSEIPELTNATESNRRLFCKQVFKVARAASLHILRGEICAIEIVFEVSQSGECIGHVIDLNASSNYTKYTGPEAPVRKHWTCLERLTDLMMATALQSSRSCVLHAQAEHTENVFREIMMFGTLTEWTLHTATTCKSLGVMRIVPDGNSFQRVPVYDEEEKKLVIEKIQKKRYEDRRWKLVRDSSLCQFSAPTFGYDDTEDTGTVYLSITLSVPPAVVQVAIVD